jgi:hypothetical protein
MTLSKDLDKIINQVKEGKVSLSNKDLKLINEIGSKIKKAKQEESNRQELLKKFDDVIESNKELVENIKNIKIDVASAKVDPIEVKIPEIKIPDIKLPTINVPKVEIPEIIIPTPLPPIVNINTDLLIENLGLIREAVGMINLSLPTTAKNPISVRLSDGEKFYKAVGSLVSAVSNNLIFKDSTNMAKAALVDGDGHQQVDVLSLPDVKVSEIPLANGAATEDKQDDLITLNTNHICTDNTTDTPLGSGETFTGVWQDCLNYQEVNISVDADKNSATNGLVIQWSADGTNIADTDVFSVYANAGTNYTPNPAFRYVRVVYTNGSQAQTRFSLMTILRRSVTGGSFHRIDSTLKDDSDARLNITVPKLKTAANTYVSQTATTAGNAKMSLEELESGISDNSKSQLKTSSYMKTGDTTFQVPRLDIATHSIQTIEYEHHEIHSGSHYFVESSVDLPINNVFDMQFTTPNTASWTHFTFDLACESETNWYIYEGATINTAGTTITPVNNDRNSIKTSGNTVAGITNGSVVDANADTATAGATLIASGIIGAGRTGGNTERNREIIFKQNTIYCLRAVAVAAGYISFNAQWYEHTNKTA